jgi:tetratricopeptide (TPR) repeat protein
MKKVTSSMPKISHKVTVAIAAMIGLIGIGGIANSAKNIKFNRLNSLVKFETDTCRQLGGILFNEDAMFHLAQFEYQLFLAEYYSHNDNYQKGQDCFAKAAFHAKASLGASSFPTFIAYHDKGEIEEKHLKFDEAHEDYKAALAALPMEEEYDDLRCIGEFSVICTAADKGTKENIPFYRQHLALVEKLAPNGFSIQQFVYALWILGKALDDDQEYVESEPLWNKMINQARLANLSRYSFELYLVEFANHEMSAGHYVQSETAISQALKIASKTGDADILASGLEIKGDLYLRQNDLGKAEGALIACLIPAKKLKNKRSLCLAYSDLSEIARKRGNLAQQEEYLKNVMEMTEDPTQKTEYLFTLAVIRAQDKEALQTNEYCKQWKQSVKKSRQEDMSITAQDLKILLTLYPCLSSPDKKEMSARNVNFNFKKNQERLNYYQEAGYSLSSKQTDKLINCIDSSARPISKNDAQKS